MANTETIRIEVEVPLDDWKAVIELLENMTQKTDLKVTKASSKLFRVTRKPEPKAVQVPEEIQHMSNEALASETQKQQEAYDRNKHYGYANRQAYHSQRDQFIAARNMLVILRAEMTNREDVRLAA